MVSEKIMHFMHNITWMLHSQYCIKQKNTHMHSLHKVGLMHKEMSCLFTCMLQL